MAIKIYDEFTLTTGKPIDSRFILTKAQMKAVDETKYPAVYFAICSDDSTIYTFDKNNTVDPDTGKFRVVKSGTSVEIDGVTIKKGTDGKLYVDQTALDTKQDKLIAGENIKIAEDGKTISAIASKKNPYNYIKQKADYLFEVQYSTEHVDYDAANTFFHSIDGKGFFGCGGGCTGVVKDGKVLRHLDWYYDNDAEFIIRRPGDPEKGINASVGTVTGVKGLTKQIVESGAYDEKFNILPFCTVDGVNEYGLFVQMNVVPQTEEYNINPTATEEACVLMVPRYILDKCSTIEQAVDVFNNVHIYSMNGQTFGFHFLLAQANEWKIVELANSGCVVVDSSTNPLGIMSNFRTNGLTFVNNKVEWPSIEQYGNGVERFDLASDCLINGQSLDSIRSDLMYSHTYTNGSETRWYTEFCGKENPMIPGTKLTIDDAQNHQEYFTAIFLGEQEHWYNKDRNEGVNSVWHTTHSSIYDLNKKSFNIAVQENLGTTFNIYLDEEETGGITKEYVDSRDVATLKSAKDYADNIKTLVDEDITVINNKIDTSASSTDKLIPESKINAKISAMTSRKLYKDATQHSFATHAELVGATKYYDAAGVEVTVNVNDSAFVEADETHGDGKTLYTVASINPTVWGYVMNWTDNEIILNGKSKVGETVSIYAPETYGAEGAVQIAHGEGKAPTWGEMSEANVVYYQHNVNAKDTDGLFVSFSFVNNVKEPYSTEHYTTSDLVNKAVGQALWDAGFRSKNNSLLAQGIKNGSSCYFSVCGSNNNTGFWYIRGGDGWVQGAWNYFYDTVVKVGGSKGYSNGTGIAVNADGVISATQHTKLYTATLAKNTTSVTVDLDENYVVVNHIAKNASNKEIMLDVAYDTNKAIFSIDKAVTFDIPITVIAVNSVDGTIALTCPFPVGSVYTSIGEASPDTIWAGTHWQQLADGQFLMNTTDNTILNTRVDEQLPNITGKLLDGLDGWYVMSNIYLHEGALSAVNNTSLYRDRSNGATKQARHRQINFNAHDSNAVYTDNGKVRPLSLACKMWIRLS